MNLKSAMEEAFQRGEKIKKQVVNDVMNSQVLHRLLENELFLKSITKAVNTKYEIERAVKSNFKAFMKAVNLPSRDEISTMERKIHRLENEIAAMHRPDNHSSAASGQTQKKTKVARSTKPANGARKTGRTSTKKKTSRKTTARKSKA